MIVANIAKQKNEHEIVLQQTEQFSIYNPFWMRENWKKIFIKPKKDILNEGKKMKIHNEIFISLSNGKCEILKARLPWSGKFAKNDVYFFFCKNICLLKNSKWRQMEKERMNFDEQSYFYSHYWFRFKNMSYSCNDLIIIL